MARIYLSYAPLLGEESTRRLIRASHETQISTGVVRMEGDRKCKIGERSIQTPDAMLDFGEDLVLIEIFAGRISAEARSSLDKGRLREALDRATTCKLIEFADRTRDLLNGAPMYPDLELTSIRRIWPVLTIAGDPILQTPALWHYLAASAPRAFVHDAKVKRPTIMTWTIWSRCSQSCKRKEHYCPTYSRTS